MVIQLTDLQNPNVRIVVPCCYCHLRRSDLSVILKSLDENAQKNFEIKNIETHCPVKGNEANSKKMNQSRQDKIVNERQHELQKQYSLLNLQFDRWWGWNWLRKRKGTMNKVKVKCHKICGKKCCDLYNDLLTSIEPEKNSENAQFQEIVLQNIQELYNTPRSSVIQINCKESHIHTSFIPHITYKLNHPTRQLFTGERRTDSEENVSVQQSESSSSSNEINAERIMRNSRKRKTIKEKMKKLTEKLHRLTSSSSVKKSEKCTFLKTSDDTTSNISFKLNKAKYTNLETKEVSKERKKEQINEMDLSQENENTCDIINIENDKNKFINPHTGKIHDLSLPKGPYVYVQSDKSYIKPISIKDDDYVAKTEFNWLPDYNSIKDEHYKLLEMYFEIMNMTNTNMLNEVTYLEKGIQVNDVKNVSDKEIQTIQEKMKLEMKDEEQNTEETLSIREIKIEDENLLSANSLKCDKCRKNNNDCNSIECGDKCVSYTRKNIRILDINEQNEHKMHKFVYDLNYINNNLLSFSSRITDTEFLEENL